MKANEAKSRFVYPDKLYARTNNNVTLDISYAPQNMEAVEYTRTDAFIDKACEWLKDNIESGKYISADEESYRLGCPYDYFEANMFIEDFKNAMSL